KGALADQVGVDFFADARDHRWPAGAVRTVLPVVSRRAPTARADAATTGCARTRSARRERSAGRRGVRRALDRGEFAVSAEARIQTANQGIVHRRGGTPGRALRGISGERGPKIVANLRAPRSNPLRPEVRNAAARP